ncbi:vacuolar protein sorting-associated protein [Anaeramoeba ignava]|uniref:Vacuolar protein sorting-associated protein n=1 Tax=Anaeramoeba ignava TaxID=1746090 RepID=A0A9Q0LZ12_ANAIG|nr:vacuolar protein sorting-associated protein [Anaeramoeba ignava]
MQYPQQPRPKPQSKNTYPRTNTSYGRNQPKVAMQPTNQIGVQSGYNTMSGYNNMSGRVTTNTRPMSGNMYSGNINQQGMGYGQPRFNPMYPQNPMQTQYGQQQQVQYGQTGMQQFNPNVQNPQQIAKPRRIDGIPREDVPKNKNHKIKRYKDLKEREKFDDLANLFSILMSTEHLENSYSKGVIQAQQYTKACNDLIMQYQTAIKGIDNSPEFEEIKSSSKSNFPHAYQTLIETGTPITLRLKNLNRQEDDRIFIAEAVSSFITAMDGLKLNMLAVDQVQPLLKDILTSLNKISDLDKDFQGKILISKWEQILDQMRAHEELDEDQARQLTFDLEKSYTAFMTVFKK